jgi:hypothetical protein
MRLFVLLVLGFVIMGASNKVDVKLTKEQEKEIIQMLDMLEDMELVDSLQFYEYLESGEDLNEKQKEPKSRPRDH